MTTSPSSHNDLSVLVLCSQRHANDAYYQDVPLHSDKGPSSGGSQLSPYLYALNVFSVS
jgi:hypothetical protein